jgi:hypothetical protein
MSDTLRSLIYNGILDDASGGEGGKEGKEGKDAGKKAGSPAAAQYAAQNIKLRVAHLLHQWVEDEEDAEEDADYGQMLAELFTTFADEDNDGEITAEEEEIFEHALAAGWDYLAENGIDEEDIDLVLNEFDPDAAARVREALKAALPDGEDEAQDKIDAFAFSDSEEGSVFDSALTLDAYKKQRVIRNGVAVIKRVWKGAKRRLSAARKAALRKANRAAQRASAMFKRIKSRMKGFKRGLYKH